MKNHCHEIEMKYKVQANKVQNFIAALKQLGFKKKSENELVDRWLPNGKAWLRLRKQTKNGKSTYEIASKKTVEKNDGIKNKCEAEKRIKKSRALYLLRTAKQIRRALPTVHKTRTSWTVTINGRKYTAVIDKVKKLGKFNGFYFELETLVPFDVDDPRAKSDVKKLAAKIMNAAYKGTEGKPTQCELMSYRKMALAHLAKQLRAKRAKLKSIKPKRARSKQQNSKQLPTHHCQ
jgi:adenylate cyclase class IV